MAQPAPPIEARNLAEIANQLTALADGLRIGRETQSQASVHSEVQGHSKTELRKNSLKLARQAYGDRRRREAFLGSSDFLGEPAWDILLDLYIAQGTSQEVSVSSACIGSAAPATTGLRWLGILQEAGLVTRINDDDDHRRVLVQLSTEGTSRMDAYFAAVAGKSRLRAAKPKCASENAAISNVMTRPEAKPSNRVKGKHEFQND